ncbi:flagellar protein FliT [Salmonella enterica subsp. enterica serovar Choleraesuis]|nr:flagellar protein FliT [Salmonella enterica subsp. enterica serovar Choleraesuis]
MTNSTALLTEWQYLLVVSQRMLDLARRGEWQALVEGETEYIILVEKLGKLPPMRLNAKSEQQLRELLVTLMDNERQVKELLAQRMSELKSLIVQNQRQQSLVTTYGQLSGRLLVGDTREH